MTIEIINGDITKIKNIDVIVNSANAVGIMGAGVAGAIKRAGGEIVSKYAREECKLNGPFDVGDVYITDSGYLKRINVLYIYHAVVMKYPGSFTSVDIVNKALDNTLKKCVGNGIGSISIPGMGIGVGGLNKTFVAQNMASLIKKYDNLINVKIVDIDEEFIKEFEKAY